MARVLISPIAVLKLITFIGWFLNRQRWVIGNLCGYLSTKPSTQGVSYVIEHCKMEINIWLLSKYKKYPKNWNRVLNYYCLLKAYVPLQKKKNKYKIVLIHYKVNIYRYNSRLTHLSVSSATHIGGGKQCYPRFLQDQINQRMHSYLQLIKHTNSLRCILYVWILNHGNLQLHICKVHDTSW